MNNRSNVFVPAATCFPLNPVMRVPGVPFRTFINRQKKESISIIFYFDIESKSVQNNEKS
jgi:hypothetical protein